jgi:hypothetical protein
VVGAGCGERAVLDDGGGIVVVGRAARLSGTVDAPPAEAALSPSSPLAEHAAAAQTRPSDAAARPIVVRLMASLPGARKQEECRLEGRARPRLRCAARRRKVVLARGARAAEGVLRTSDEHDSLECM